MGRPKGSKNKSKNAEQHIGAEFTDGDETRADLPAVTDGPPDRLAEHRAAEEKAEADAKKVALFDNRTVIHQAVEDAAAAYNEIKIQRSALSKQEKAARDHLYLKMTGHKLNRYKTKDGWIVQLQAQETVVTKREDGDSVEGVTYSKDSGQINPGSDEDEDDADMNLDIEAPIGERDERPPGEVAA